MVLDLPSGLENLLSLKGMPMVLLLEVVRNQSQHYTCVLSIKQKTFVLQTSAEGRIGKGGLK